MKEGPSATHIVLVLGGNRIDKVLLGHEVFSVLVLLCMTDEVEAGLVRQLRVLRAADQGLLDSFLNTRHCVAGKRGESTLQDLTRDQKRMSTAHTGGRGERKMESGERGGLSQKE